MTTPGFFGLMLATFLAMEVVAGLVHRFVMHGPLWVWHADHHNPRGTVFQFNDLFALMFAVPSWLLIMTGMQAGAAHWRTALGFGILAYGVVYTLVHENIIHRRFPWRLKLEHWYFHALREAHAVHHRRQVRVGCENFGMLAVPVHYFLKQRQQLRLRAEHSVRRAH
jgi:beta-carotene 3-hydroxylase